MSQECPRCNYKGAELYCPECNYSDESGSAYNERIPKSVLKYLHEVPSENDYPQDTYSFEIEEPDGPLDLTPFAVGGLR